MDPVKNQMNSMYQAPMQQGGHRTSILSIVVLLLIAIIVAVLGFGRINALKQEDARAANDAMAQQPQVQHAPQQVDVNAELDAVLSSDDNSASDTAAIDGAFK